MRKSLPICMAILLAPMSVEGGAQTMQAPVMGGMTATQVGIEPMMRVDPATFAAACRTAAQFELASARLALARSRSPQVRVFAGLSLREHGPALQQLGSPTQLGRALQGSLNYARMLDDLKRVDAAGFDRLYLSQQVEAHRHSWALNSGYAVDGRDVRLRAFARRAVMIEEAHLRRLPIKPMAY